MIWMIAAAVLVFVLAFAFFGRRGPTVRQSMRQDQQKVSVLPEEEKIAAEAALRETASESYDTGFSNARSIGKDDRFAHQIGVLNAVCAIILRRKANQGHEMEEMQGETVPFNLLPPDEGRAAIVEYLVWKYLPDRADESKFLPALSSFRTKIFEDAERLNDHGLPFSMIYACKYDWQRYIAERIGK